MILEICVDSVAGLNVAIDGGADRVELCAALSVGGLTPGPGLMAAAAGCGVPVMAMIRARPGDFVMTAQDVAVARADIAAARMAGLEGVVIGASLPDGRLDAAALAEQTAEAQGLDVTLHRCFDLVPDVAEALDVMRRVGISRVLTSGGATSALKGLERLAQTIELAGNDITIMPGSGVSLATIGAIRALGVREVHSSCSSPVRQPPEAVAFGFALEGAMETDAQLVAGLKAALR